MSEPTPRPWYVGYEDGSGRVNAAEGGTIIAREEEDRLGLGAIVVAGGADSGCPLGVRKEADAEFIVRACNAHDEMVAALEEILKAGITALGRLEPGLRAPLITAVDNAKAALLKAHE